jgi:hypothetical protein
MVSFRILVPAHFGLQPCTEATRRLSDDTKTTTLLRAFRQIIITTQQIHQILGDIQKSLVNTFPLPLALASPVQVSTTPLPYSTLLSGQTGGKSQDIPFLVQLCRRVIMTSLLPIISDIIPMVMPAPVHVTKATDLDAGTGQTEGMIRKGAIVNKSEEICASGP